MAMNYRAGSSFVEPIQLLFLSKYELSIFGEKDAMNLVILLPLILSHVHAHMNVRIINMGQTDFPKDVSSASIGAC